MSDVLVVRAAVAPLHAEPRAGAEQASQVLAGHVVERVDAREPWLRVRAPDGYDGWMHRGYVMEMGSAAYARQYGQARVSLGCEVREASGVRRALPLGARLDSEARIERGDAVDGGAMASRFPRSPAAAAATARDAFTGTSYQWGGVTPWGADCSGMVQTAFGLHGLPLPRAAREQAAHGVLVAGGLSALEAGDLAFFSDRTDGRVTHVAIALGAMRLVHLAIGRGGYALETLDTPDEYAKLLIARFLEGRRLG